VDCFEWVKCLSYFRISHNTLLLVITAMLMFDYLSLSVPAKLPKVILRCEWVEYDWSRHLWIHLLVLVFSTLSAYLSWKYILDVMNIIRREQGTKKKRVPIDDIPATFALIGLKNNKYLESMAKTPSERRNNFKIKPEMTSFAENFQKLILSKTEYTVNRWNVTCLVGNVFQLSGVIIYFLDLHQRLIVTNIFFGVGCMIAWFNLGRYLEYSPKYFIVFSTLFAALPTTLRFVMANLPVFVGYAFLGTCIFWQSPRFHTVSQSMMTEFALFLGDSVFDIFKELTEIDYWLSQVYLYTFLIMFFTVVQNFFISIIQYSYFSFEDLAKKRAKLYETMGTKKDGKGQSVEEAEAELTKLKKEVREKNLDWSRKLKELEAIVSSKKEES